jgi:hypothetical protein
LLKHIGKQIRQLVESAVRVVLDGSVLSQPSDCQVRRARSIGMAINGLVRDVEALIVREPF